MNKKTAVALVATVVAGGFLYYSGVFTSFVQAPAETDFSPETIRELVSEPIAGVWQSTDDPRFTREFIADGRVIDRYEGESTSVGVWTVFIAASAPADVAFTPDPHSVYLRITDGDVIYTYNLSALTPTDLSMTYMDRGGMLHFRKK